MSMEVGCLRAPLAWPESIGENEVRSTAEQWEEYTHLFPQFLELLTFVSARVLVYEMRV